MATYKPIKHAYNTFEPAGGADESLSPIIFLHSFGFSKELWHDIPQIISDETKRRSYAVDIRDHGDTEWTDDFSFTILIQDLKYFMDSMNIPKAALIGHSMGGWAAGMLAMEEPERVELLIIEDMYVEKITRSLMDTIMAFTCVWQEAARSVPKGVNENEVNKYIVDYIFSTLTPLNETYFTKRERLYECKFPIKKLEDGSYDVKQHMKELKRAALNYETFSIDAEDVYPGPTYVLYGNASNLKVYQHKARLQENFPYLSMILFDGATHNVHVEFPEKFVEVVLMIFKNTKEQDMISD